jgi:hypothetical protein
MLEDEQQNKSKTGRFCLVGLGCFVLLTNHFLMAEVDRYTDTLRPLHSS